MDTHFFLWQDPDKRVESCLSSPRLSSYQYNQLRVKAVKELDIEAGLAVVKNKNPGTV